MDFKIQIGPNYDDWVYISLPETAPQTLVDKLATAIAEWSDEETKRSIKEQVAKGNLPECFLLGL